MADLACRLSDRAVLTSDNPRYEDPQVILDQMQAGVRPTDADKYLTVPDRREAIRTACALARPGDIVLVAGKGHENYQEIQGQRTAFDDRQVLQEAYELLSL
jgi:UDP-N-acetylmuramoyl-L-alanyl-D-glutamate--2,6-diaminopimelate ligase